MALHNFRPDTFLPLGGLLPDFVLAFTFFTALTYAALGKYLDHRRSTVAVSGALGFALSIGLVWWEYDHGWSVRDLAPAAIVILVVFLALVAFRALRKVGGSIGAFAVALAIGLVAVSLMGDSAPMAADAVYSLVVLFLLIGFVALAIHAHGYAPLAGAPRMARRERLEADREVRRLYRDRVLGKKIGKQLRRLRKDTELLGDTNGDSTNVMLQIRRLLPEQGWLTEQIARLREKTHHARNGHVARIEELRHLIRDLPTEARKRASDELKTRYAEVDLDRRLERLDRAVAENEKRIRDLTREARDAVARREFRRVDGLLKAAKKLQSESNDILKRIVRTERKLTELAEKAVREVAAEVSHD